MENKKSLFAWVENNLRLVVVLSLLATLVLPYLLSLPACRSFFELYKGHYVGDAIGGITAPVIGLVSIILLYLTFKAQKDAAYKTALENRIFQMIDLHRKNVELMHSEISNLDGQEVFKMICGQINMCVEDLSAFFEKATENEVLLIPFRNKLQENYPNVDPLSFAKIDIAYSIVFWGFRDPSMEALVSLLSKRYVKDFYMPVINYLSLRPVAKSKDPEREWEQLMNETVEAKVRFAEAIRNPERGFFSEMYRQRYPVLFSRNYERLYWGHHLRLGHYFRHLYAVVDYVNSQSKLSEEEKYEYVKMIRTQLSNTEQMIIMANSLSDMGKEWEMFKKNSDDTPFITRYNFIKNIPEKEVFGFNYRIVYPDVNYEF